VTYLLDVNILIALCWPTHVHHLRAHKWFARLKNKKWATCPHTETGFVRISSNPVIIKDAVSPLEAFSALKILCLRPNHVFWPGTLSAVELPHVLRGCTISGHRQITDFYLLGLAIKYKGYFVTFDKKMIAQIPPNSDIKKRIITPDS